MKKECVKSKKAVTLWSGMSNQKKLTANWTEIRRVGGSFREENQYIDKTESEVINEIGM